jgi:hypothetical protein
MPHLKYKHQDVSSNINLKLPDIRPLCRLRFSNFSANLIVQHLLLPGNRKPFIFSMNYKSLLFLSRPECFHP